MAKFLKNGQNFLKNGQTFHKNGLNFKKWPNFTKKLP